MLLFWEVLFAWPALAGSPHPSPYAKPVAFVDSPSSFSQRGDSDKSGGKRSIIGGGHAVSFSVQDANLNLTGVQIYGSRFGSPAAPRKTFHIWLCDENMRSLAKFTYLYSTFERGDPHWVDIRVEPTRVSTKYIICVGFDPTPTDGVYVHFDDKPGNRCFTGLPGKKPKEFKEGNWMIRANLREDWAGPRK